MRHEAKQDVVLHESRIMSSLQTCQNGTDPQSLLSRRHRLWHRQTKSTPEECDLKPTADQKKKGICSTIRPVMPIRPVPKPTLSQAQTSPMFGSEMLRVPKPTRKVRWYSWLFRRWKQRTRLRKDVNSECLECKKNQFLSRAYGWLK